MLSWKMCNSPENIAPDLEGLPACGMKEEEGGMYLAACWSLRSPSTQRSARGSLQEDMGMVPNIGETAPMPYLLPYPYPLRHYCPCFTLSFKASVSISLHLSLQQ